MCAVRVEWCVPVSTVCIARRFLLYDPLFLVYLRLDRLSMCAPRDQWCVPVSAVGIARRSFLRDSFP